MSHFSNFTYKGQAVDFTAGTSFSFTSKDIGTASVHRAVLVNVQSAQSTGGAALPTTVTVNSVTLTLLTSAVDTTAGYSQGVYIALVPTGTSVTIAVTYGASQDSCAIQWCIFQPDSLTPTFSHTYTGSSVTSITGNVQGVTDGVSVWFSVIDSLTIGSIGWTGYDTYYNKASGSATLRWSIDTLFLSVDETAGNATVNISGGSASGALSVVSFGPEFSLATTVSETVGTAETTAAALRYSPTTSESIKFDIAGEDVRPNFSLTLSQGIGTAPATSYAYRPGRVISEVLDIAEAVTGNTKLPVSSADTMTIASQLLAGRPVAVAEGVGMAPALSLVRGVLVAETLGIADVLAAAWRLGVSLSEALRAQDVLQRFLGAGVADGVGVALAQSPAWVLPRSVSEGVGVADALAPKLVVRITAADTIGIADADALKLIFRPVVNDGIEIEGLYIAPAGGVTTWAVNTNTGAVSEYTNYDFNSFAQLGMRYLGATRSGLYVLDGDTDAGTNITARLRSGLMRFAGSRFAGFKAVYLGIRGDGEVFFRLITGDGVSRTYRVTTESMRTTRVTVGKGIRASYFAFELENIAGMDFDLDAVEFIPMPAQRRV